MTSTLSQLRSEIKDSADNYKIKERKNIQLAKDLKKQLGNEQKRSAKLQDRLQQVRTDCNKYGQIAGGTERLQQVRKDCSKYGLTAAGTV